MVIQWFNASELVVFSEKIGREIEIHYSNQIVANDA